MLKSTLGYRKEEKRSLSCMVNRITEHAYPSVTEGDRESRERTEKASLKSKLLCYVFYIISCSAYLISLN